MAEQLHVVTGAFGFTGRYIARRLLDAGVRVRTLTNHPQRRAVLGESIDVAPLDFTDTQALVANMRGATVLYNTYWVRFERGDRTFERAIANTRTLISAASEAGVQRLVHVSITNPSADSPFPYFRGKAVLEHAVGSSGLSHAILRPAVIFGREDVLINNIAWLLRRAPVFAVPGSGDYELQPIYVGDMARLAVEAGGRRTDETIDAIGPETYRFNDLVRLIADVVGSRAQIVHLPPTLALELSRVIGFALRDVVLTRDEVDGLRANLLVTNSPPAGTTKLSEWLRTNAQSVGGKYASELARHYR